MTENSPQKVCPICLKLHNDPPTISRYDNKTAICSDCGIIEAFNGAIILMCRVAKFGFPSYAERMRTAGYRNDLARAIVRANHEAVRRFRGQIHPDKGV